MAALHSGDPMAVALVRAVRGGDVVALRRLLADDPGLASARIRADDGVERTPLHVAADWPGYFPHGPEVVRALLDSGADPDAPALGCPHPETPLHWAASSDDVDVAEALIDGGADIEASGASLAGGGPLDDAVGYGCWHVARLLAQRGARVDRLWHAAALGMLPRLEQLLAAGPAPTPDDITEAFWHACNGGQRRTAAYLLARGADVNGMPGYAHATPLDIAGRPDTRRDTLATWLRGQGAASTKN